MTDNGHLLLHLIVVFNTLANTLTKYPNVVFIPYVN